MLTDADIIDAVNMGGDVTTRARTAHPDLFREFDRQTAAGAASGDLLNSVLDALKDAARDGGGQ